LLGDFGRRLVLEILPKLIADNLQLHRLDELAMMRAGFAGNAYLAQIIDQPFGHVGGEGAATGFGRLFNRFLGGSAAHALHVEAGPQIIGQQRGIGIERGDMIFAHAQHNPQEWIIGHGLTELAEEIFAAGPMFQVRGHDLFKLIDDQHPGRRFIR
jgi:hypothetical protein